MPRLGAAWYSRGTTSLRSSCRCKEKVVENGPRERNKVQVMRIPVAIPRFTNYPAYHGEPLEHRHGYSPLALLQELSSGSPGEAQVAEKEKHIFITYFRSTQGFSWFVSSAWNAFSPDSPQPTIDFPTLLYSFLP